MLAIIITAMLAAWFTASMVAFFIIVWADETPRAISRREARKIDREWEEANQ